MSKFDGIIEKDDLEIINTTLMVTLYDSITDEALINTIETVETTVFKAYEYFSKHSYEEKKFAVMMMAFFFKYLFEQDELVERHLSNTLAAYNHSLYFQNKFIDNPRDCFSEFDPETH